MLVVVIYNEFISEILILVNKCTITALYITQRIQL